MQPHAPYMHQSSLGTETEREFYLSPLDLQVCFSGSLLFMSINWDRGQDYPNWGRPMGARNRISTCGLSVIA